MLNIDLHSHSTVSDGLLAPADVVARAAANGCKVFALTDHDDVSGLEEARAAAEKLNMMLVNGVEISVSWGERTLHIVGLRINPEHPTLKQGLASVRVGRIERAQRMAADLERVGIKGSFEGAWEKAPNKEMISRAHFARFLCEQGYAKSMKAVFKKYLVKGKPGYVKHEWTSLQQAVEWIHASGGVAVIAHPGRYDLGPNLIRKLLAEFKACGGDAIEVVTANHSKEQFSLFARYAQLFGLLASVGSDFHGQGEGYGEPGRLPDLPVDCQPVWHDWPEAPFFDLSFREPLKTVTSSSSCKAPRSE